MENKALEDLDRHAPIRDKRDADDMDQNQLQQQQMTKYPANDDRQNVNGLGGMNKEDSKLHAPVGGFHGQLEEEQKLDRRLGRFNEFALDEEKGRATPLVDRHDRYHGEQKVRGLIEPQHFGADDKHFDKHYDEDRPHHMQQIAAPNRMGENQVRNDGNFHEADDNGEVKGQHDGIFPKFDEKREDESVNKVANDLNPGGKKPDFDVPEGNDGNDGNLPKNDGNFREILKKVENDLHPGGKKEQFDAPLGNDAGLADRNLPMLGANLGKDQLMKPV